MILFLSVLSFVFSMPVHAAIGDMILNTSITLTFSDNRDGWETARNVTMLKEGYSLFLDDVTVHYDYIGNFSVHKNGEVVKNLRARQGDIIYYNKTIDGREYRIIEAKVDTFYVTHRSNS